MICAKNYENVFTFVKVVRWFTVTFFLDMMYNYFAQVGTRWLAIVQVTPRWLVVSQVSCVLKAVRLANMQSTAVDYPQTLSSWLKFSGPITASSTDRIPRSAQTLMFCQRILSSRKATSAMQVFPSLVIFLSLQCFDSVGLATGWASRL